MTENTSVKSKMPVRKVAAGGIAGAVTVIVVWLVGLAGVDVPADVASAFTVIVSFAAGWLTSEKTGDHVA